MHVDDMNDLVLMGLAKEEAFAMLEKAEAEIERLRAALQEVYDHCQNEGYGNPVVDQRIVDRCEETALLALKR